MDNLGLFACTHSRDLFLIESPLNIVSIMHLVYRMHFVMMCPACRKHIIHAAFQIHRECFPGKDAADPSGQRQKYPPCSCAPLRLADSCTTEVSPRSRTSMSHAKYEVVHCKFQMRWAGHGPRCCHIGVVFILVQYHTSELVSPNVLRPSELMPVSIWFLLCLKELWIDKTGASLSTSSKSTTKLMRRLRQSRITSTPKQGNTLGFHLRVTNFCVSVQRSQGSKVIRVLCLRSNVPRQRRSIQFHERRRGAVPRMQEVSA